MASTWSETLARVRSLVGALRELFRPEKRERAERGELTWLHPQVRHGVYLRKDGTVDVQTRGSVFGLGAVGSVWETPSVYIGTGSFVVRAERLAFKVPPDGYYLGERILHPQLVLGKSVSSLLYDAWVLVKPESISALSSEGTLKTARREPIRVGNLQLAAVPLSDLFDSIPFTLRPDSAAWIDEVISALQRGLVGGEPYAG